MDESERAIVDEIVGLIHSPAFTTEPKKYRGVLYEKTFTG